MEQERLVKGIRIPIEVWEDTRLTWAEKVLLMEIDSFTKNGIDCFFSDEYAGKFLNVSTRSAASYISHLVELGLVKKTKFDGRKRYLQSSLNIPVLQSRYAEIAEQECKNCITGMQNLQSNNISNNNTSLIDNRESIESAERTAPHPTGFSKPTIDQLVDFINKNSLRVDARVFYNYYESNGWKVGRNPMEQWDKALWSWHYREQNEHPEKKSPTIIDNNFNPYN